MWTNEIIKSNVYLGCKIKAVVIEYILSSVCYKHTQRKIYLKRLSACNAVIFFFLILICNINYILFFLLAYIVWMDRDF